MKLCLVIFCIFTACNLVWMTHAAPKNPNSLSRAKRNLVQFAMMIKCATGRSALKYNGYGCWCGKGGSGNPVDATDRCCQRHDHCYDRVIASKVCPLRINVYTVFYIRYRCDKCSVRLNNHCQRNVCLCDSAAVKCFAASSFNSTYEKYDRRRCHPSWLV